MMSAYLQEIVASLDRPVLLPSLLIDFECVGALAYVESPPMSGCDGGGGTGRLVVCTANLSARINSYKWAYAYLFVDFMP